MNTEKNSGVSEPKLKRSRNSDYARVSDMGNDISKNNPDLGESEKQLIPNKKLGIGIEDQMTPRLE